MNHRGKEMYQADINLSIFHPVLYSTEGALVSYYVMTTEARNFKTDKRECAFKKQQIQNKGSECSVYS